MKLYQVIKFLRFAIYENCVSCKDICRLVCSYPQTCMCIYFSLLKTSGKSVQNCNVFL